MLPFLLWPLALLLIVVGLAGTLLPALPGAPLVFMGLVTIAWIDHFTRVGGYTIAVLAGLMVLSLVVDIVATALGATRVNASKLAILGAALGTFAGICFGLVGLLCLPFVGAVVGQYISRPDFFLAGKVGLATWIGFVCGVLAKIVIVFMMIGLFIVTYFW